MTSPYSLMPYIRRTSSIGDILKIHISEELRKERELLDIMVENRKAALGESAITKLAMPTYEMIVKERDRHAWETPEAQMIKAIRKEEDDLEERLIRQQRHRDLAKQHKAEGKPWGRPKKVSE